MSHVLSGTVEFSQIWRNLVLNPTQLHPNALGVHELFRRPMERFCNVTAVPLNIEKRMSFLFNTLPESAKVQWKIVLQDLVR